MCTSTGSANAASTPTCGSTKILKPGGGYWVCSWADEFNGWSLDASKWSVQTTAASGVSGGPACFINSHNNVHEDYGTLKLVTRKETKPFVCSSPTGNFVTQYTGGSVFSWGKFSQLYGRFEVRAAFPSSTVAGLQEALWMWPDNPIKYGAWPRSGEIDIAESASLHADRVIPYIHYMSGTDLNVTNNYCMIKYIGQMHRYTLVWTPTNMTILYDDKVCISDNLPSTNPFNQPFFMALTQGLGIAPNTFTAGKTPLPGTTRIDYVRVWK